MRRSDNMDLKTGAIFFGVMIGGLAILAISAYLISKALGKKDEPVKVKRGLFGRG